MQSLDYVLLTAYLVAVAAVGVALSAKVRSSADMFAAGGRSPWWASGLSGFMTMFSAGTFVVWGGLAFERGLVGVSINLCLGVAALLVGFLVAPRWHELGVRTPAHYVELRFGRSALHAYTWLMMAVRLIGSAVALHALAVMLAELMEVPEWLGFLRTEDGHLTREAAIAAFGGVVVAYTMTGGLWAVLITDVLQFLVLNVVVLFMVPILFEKVGGLSGFVERAPDGFLLPFDDEFTVWYLGGWIVVHFLMIGGELAYAQRYMCVPTKRDARWSALLFGGLYLVSPFLWMFPPLAYRVMNPDTVEISRQMKETAYVNACEAVLPLGMVGLMLAAMFSATASMVSSQLNVFAGVVTEDIVRRARPNMTPGALLAAGRYVSGALGLVVVAVALAVPALGGAQEVVLKVTNLCIGPLTGALVFGLLVPQIGRACFVQTLIIGFAAGAIASVAGLHDVLGVPSRWVEIVTGIVIPISVVAAHALILRGRRDDGFERVRGTVRRAGDSEAEAVSESDPIAAQIVAYAVVILGLTLGLLALVAVEYRVWMVTMAFCLAVCGASILYFINNNTKSREIQSA